jgi:hypothetical protein
MKQKFSECLTKCHRSTAYFFVVTLSAVESEEAERGFRTSLSRALNEIYDVIDMDRNVSCEQYISTRHSIVRKEPVSKFEKCFIFES